MSKKLIVWFAVLMLIAYAMPLCLATGRVVDRDEEECSEALENEAIPCRDEDENHEQEEEDEEDDEDEDDEDEDDEDEDDEDEGFGEMEAKVLDFLKKHVPAAHARIRALAEEDQDAYEEQVDEFSNMIEEYYEGLEANPPAARAWLAYVKLETQIDILVEKIHAEEDKAKTKGLQAQLKVLLDKAFDLQIENRKADLDILKQEVKEIEVMIERRQTNKQKIIDRHFRHLVKDDNEDDELAW